ncbi:MAG: 4-(cytidine 5'-diphospho)-2-C-methyl-D-erythritol kinase, partial [Prochloraceae cyanobacterium]|nr:4-(cytidine 5'-diphospho)-2-C-methyl-D-erythritol kinase [Prochloraceae cyanobacterium]
KRVARLKDICQQAGGLGTMMSGSGPTVFTICETEAEAREVKQKIRNNLDDSALELWVSEFSSAGIQIAVCK